MFAFYDFETTGTSPAFDQPLQFAAILTDDDFNEVERVNLRCRLAPHILPAPWAMAVTGVTPDMLEDPNLPTWFEFSHEISDLVGRWAPATWTGYNTIAFDEEFLRQTFFQNLHPDLYKTQFDGNDRLDLMKVIYAVWELDPGIVQWPMDDQGRPVFKLDRIAPANGFGSHAAHDALGDVEATIHIARLIRDHAPALWNRCLRNRDKNEVGGLLEAGHPVRLIERFSAAPPRSYVGVYAGRNLENPNAMAFLDLDLCDPATLLDADDATIAAAVSATPKLIRTVAANKVPNLFPIASPTPAHALAARAVSSRPDFQERVGRALSERFADRDEPQQVEERIYGGFYSNPDKRLLEAFKTSEWKVRADLVSQLSDDRLKQLGQRLIFLNAPELVSDTYRVAAKAAIQEKWHSNDPDALWTTAAAIEKQLGEIAAQNALVDNKINRLRRFYRDRLAAVAS